MIYGLPLTSLQIWEIATGKYMVENTIQMEYCPGSTIEYINYGALLPATLVESTYFPRIDLLSDYTDVIRRRFNQI
jgi:hypothetical protein